MPRAVAADQSHDLALVQVDRRVAHGMDTAEATLMPHLQGAATGSSRKWLAFDVIAFQPAAAPAVPGVEADRHVRRARPPSCVGAFTPL